MARFQEAWTPYLPDRLLPSSLTLCQRGIDARCGLSDRPQRSESNGCAARGSERGAPTDQAGHRQQSVTAVRLASDPRILAGNALQSAWHPMRPTPDTSLKKRHNTAIFRDDFSRHRHPIRRSRHPAAPLHDDLTPLRDNVSSLRHDVSPSCDDIGPFRALSGDSVPPRGDVATLSRRFVTEWGRVVTE